MTDRVINYELLDFTMKYIQTNPENHHQGDWFRGDEIDELSGTHVADMSICGSQACFAGWAAIFAGWHQVRPHLACIECNESKFSGNCQCIYPMFETRQDLVVDETGRVTSMAVAAQEALGLTRHQARSMFSGGNSRHTLEHMVNRLHDNGNAVL